MTARHVHVHIGRLIVDPAVGPRVGDDTLQRTLADAITRRLEGNADERTGPSTVVDEIALAVTHAVRNRSAVAQRPAATAAVEADHGHS